MADGGYELGNFSCGCGETSCTIEDDIMAQSMHFALTTVRYTKIVSHLGASARLSTPRDATTNAEAVKAWGAKFISQKSEPSPPQAWLAP